MTGSITWAVLKLDIFEMAEAFLYATGCVIIAQRQMWSALMFLLDKATWCLPEYISMECLKQ